MSFLHTNQEGHKFKQALEQEDQIREGGGEAEEKRAEEEEKRREYREMGFSAPGDYIKALERNTNLFESVKNSENSFTLISTSYLTKFQVRITSFGAEILKLPTEN
ncbi:hypothetical protein AKJ66_01960 [candidate division MSBL1 archaeon SCGC-AAA259E22]|uniref:Uncharacterized protein n=1 Tax=candidate division MSBL1 archaeon SCGC-AAA259E22 TaxID=1698265 RepID=A0A133UGZ2_9EURY|nr:hypothetical protein AKJ66_01960 [candidate division MSBL1 archaeon SCGC-AAA259E22]